MSHDTLSRCAALARRPKLLASVIGLALLLPSAPTWAAGRGTAQNPIPLPGTEIATQRYAPRPPHDHAIFRRGSFEARLYRVPSASLLRGLRPRLTHDASVMDAVVRGGLNTDTADYDLGTAGVRLSIDPTWGVAIEGHDIAQGEFASPATFLRTRASFAATQVGLEVLF